VLLDGLEHAVCVCVGSWLPGKFNTVLLAASSQSADGVEALAVKLISKAGVGISFVCALANAW